MRLIRTRGRLFALVLCATVFFADRLTKVMVLNNALLTEGKEIGFINGILSFSFVWNYGAAFSVLREHPEWLTAITGMILILIAFVVFAPRQEDLLSRLSLSLVLGGGLGNFADRLLHGAVVDFIRLDFINFPIFNAADIAVTAGVVIFGMGMLWPDGRKGNG